MNKNIVVLLCTAALLAMAQIDPENPPETSLEPWPGEDSLEFETVGTPWPEEELLSEGGRLLEQGRYAEAIDTLQNAITMFRTGGRQYGLSSVYDYLGRAYQVLGQFENALDCFDSALAYSRGIFEDRYAIGRTFNNIGGTYILIGRFDRALAALDSARTISLELADTAAFAATFNNIGNAYYGLGQYTRAAAVYDSSRIAGRNSGDRRAEAYLLNNLGFTYAAMNQYDRALADYDSGRVWIESSGDKYGSGIVYNNIGEAYAALGQYEKAHACYDSALARRRAIKNRYGEGVTLKNIGRLYEATGDWLKALEYYRQAIESKEMIGGDLHTAELSAAYRESEKDAYQYMIDLLIKHDRYPEAFEYLARSQSENLKEIFRGSGIESYDPSLKNELGRINALETRMAELKVGLQNGQTGTAEFDRDQAVLEGEYNQALVDLKTYHPQVYDLLEPAKRSVRDVQSGIPDRVLYVQFVGVEESYLAFLLTNSSLETELLSSRKEIDSLVETFRSALILKEKKIMESTLKSLYECLIRPLEAAVEPARDVVIIPYGPLHYLPFQAFIRSKDKNGDEYFIERKRVRYLPSASFIEEIAKKPGVRPANLIAFADADKTLPGAENEVRDLSRIYPKAEIYIGDQATKDKFLERAGNYDIVHLATHGRLDYDPRRSHIVLAPRETGDLTCREIMGLCGLFQNKTSLVTLSACETAVEKDPVRAGRELTTLADAFKRAGVPTLVATLWSVPDISTANLMREFYKNLYPGKMDKLEALRQAQIKMLRGLEYPEPYYWAPFILIGEAR